MLAFVLGTAACGPDQIDVTGAGSETGSVEIEECDATVGMVDEHGRVWGKCEQWTAWADVITEEEVQGAVDDGDWVPTTSRGGSPCYLFSPDAIACTPSFGDSMLFARPLSQLEPIDVKQDDVACSGASGAWIWTWSDGQRCRGVLPGGLVVVLLPET